MNVRFAAIAKRELFEAGRFYDVRFPGLGDRFLDEIGRALLLVKEHPFAWPKILDAETRSIRVNRFPYSVVYRVEGGAIVVYAVAHAKRRPAYWKRRLPKPA